MAEASGPIFMHFPLAQKYALEGFAIRRKGWDGTGHEIAWLTYELGLWYYNGAKRRNSFLILRIRTAASASLAAARSQWSEVVIAPAKSLPHRNQRPGQSRPLLPMEVVAKSLTQELPRFHPVVAVVAVAVAVAVVAEAVVAEAVGARVVAEPETGTAAKTTTTRRTRRNAKVIPLL
jgi:hypothetical protein